MGYDSPATEKAAGFGRPIDDPAIVRSIRDAAAPFTDNDRRVVAGLLRQAQKAGTP